MRNPDRIDPIIEALRKRWKQYPDQRLAQLLHNIISGQNQEMHAQDQFAAEDDLIIQGLGLDVQVFTKKEAD